MVTVNSFASVLNDALVTMGEAQRADTAGELTPRSGADATARAARATKPDRRDRAIPERAREATRIVDSWLEGTTTRCGSKIWTKKGGWVVQIPHEADVCG